MNIQQKSYFLQNRQVESGFTLIEFLVASALAMIVIVAAGSTYLITRNLQSKAQERLNVQQNLRNAASSIARDARNSGAFGCFSSSSLNAGSGDLKFLDKASAQKREILLDGKSSDGFGIRLLKPTDAANAGLNTKNIVFNNNDRILLFIYGKGSNTILNSNNTTFNITDSKSTLDPDLYATLEKKGDVVISSCNYAAFAKPDSTSSNEIKFSSSDVIFDNLTKSENSAQLMVSKLYASAYAVGTVNGVSSLLRYDLDASGKWQGPQLLAKNVQSMTPSFGYTVDCHNDNSQKINSEKFKFSSDLDEKQLPAILRLNLKYQYQDTLDVNNPPPAYDYDINVTIRSGNSCASTLPAV